jgi:hypothetical protein
MRASAKARAAATLLTHDRASVRAPIIRICAVCKLFEDGQVATQIGGSSRTCHRGADHALRPESDRERGGARPESTSVPPVYGRRCQFGSGLALFDLFRSSRSSTYLIAA